VKTPQHLPKLSTCPFDSRNFQTGYLDERTVDHNQQTSKQRIPGEDEIKPEQSREALSQFRHFNEIKFQRKNLSWTQEGKHKILQKLVPVVQVVFLGCLLEGGCFGVPGYNITVVRSVMSDYDQNTA
jgi:hypothetical protein